MIKWDLSQKYVWFNIQKFNVMYYQYINLTQDKKYVIILEGAEKAFDKIQNPLGQNTQ